MIRFLREHATKVVWVIVISFVVTMFAGTFFFDDVLDFSSSDSAPRSSQLGYIGNRPIPDSAYIYMFSEAMTSYRQSRPFQTPTPEVLELLQFEALMRTVQFDVLYQAAIDAGTELSKSEKTQIMEQIYQQFDVKGKRELNALLNEQNINYDQFIDFQMYTALVRKFGSDLQAKISVSDQDVDNKYTELNVRHILLKPDDAEDEAAFKARAEALHAELKEGLSFSEAVSTYSEDLNSKDNGGRLGWLGMKSVVQAFEDAMYQTPKGEFSEPVRTPSGYHILMIDDTRERLRPLDFDYNKEREALLAERRRSVIQHFVEKHLTLNPLRLEEPTLKAYRAKLEGDVDTAVASYRLLMSRNPESPIPHYLLGQFYRRLGQFESAEETLEKGIIKKELNPDLAFGLIHLELGKVYRSLGQLKKARAEFDNAIDEGQANFSDLVSLKAYFSEINDKRRLAKVDTHLNELRAKVQELIKESQEAASANITTSPNALPQSK